MSGWKNTLPKIHDPPDPVKVKMKRYTLNPVPPSLFVTLVYSNRFSDSFILQTVECIM